MAAEEEQSQRVISILLARFPRILLTDRATQCTEPELEAAC